MFFRTHPITNWIIFFFKCSCFESGNAEDVLVAKQQSWWNLVRSFVFLCVCVNFSLWHQLAILSINQDHSLIAAPHLGKSKQCHSPFRTRLHNFESWCILGFIPNSYGPVCYWRIWYITTGPVRVSKLLWTQNETWCVHWFPLSGILSLWSWMSCVELFQNSSLD